MKRVLLSVSLAMLLSQTGVAQPPGPPPGRFPGPPQGRPPGGFRDPPGFLLMSALDTDKDGKISAKEIADSVAALRKLDKNGDGKLSATEIGWPPAGGFRGPGGTGGPGFGGPGFPDFGGPAAPPRRPPMDDASSDQPTRRRFFSHAQVLSVDRNKDGKIVKEEIPRALQQRFLDRLDSNKDEVIDASELAAFAEAEKTRQEADAPKP